MGNAFWLYLRATNLGLTQSPTEMKHWSCYVMQTTILSQITGQKVNDFPPLLNVLEVVNFYSALVQNGKTLMRYLGQSEGRLYRHPSGF